MIDIVWYHWWLLVITLSLISLAYRMVAMMIIIEEIEAVVHYQKASLVPRNKVNISLLVTSITDKVNMTLLTASINRVVGVILILLAISAPWLDYLGRVVSGVSLLAGFIVALIDHLRINDLTLIKTIIEEASK